MRSLLRTVLGLAALTAAAAAPAASLVTLFDVSDANDWSSVKVWFRDADGLGGGIYPVHGFIYAPGKPDRELTAKDPDYVGAMIDAYAR